MTLGQEIGVLVIVVIAVAAFIEIMLSGRK